MSGLIFEITPNETKKIVKVKGKNQQVHKWLSCWQYSIFGQKTLFRWGYFKERTLSNFKNFKKIPHELSAKVGFKKWNVTGNLSTPWPYFIWMYGEVHLNILWQVSARKKETTLTIS